MPAHCYVNLNSVPLERHASLSEVFAKGPRRLFGQGDFATPKAFGRRQRQATRYVAQFGDDVRRPNVTPTFEPIRSIYSPDAPIPAYNVSLGRGMVHYGESYWPSYS